MIPSNLTLDEALKFYDLPQPVLDAIERERSVWQTAMGELEETERQLGIYSTFADKVSDLIQEDSTDTAKMCLVWSFYHKMERDL